jgi:hypothetical protein
MGALAAVLQKGVSVSGLDTRTTATQAACSQYQPVKNLQKNKNKQTHCQYGKIQR